jgi:ubiquinone/menaquinone biosynthesis C-methylase UbiE
MAVLPDVTDPCLVLDDGIWYRPGEQQYERWSADAAADPIHAVISGTGIDAERAKSREDVGFFLERAVDGIVLDLGCGYGRVAKYVLPLRTFAGYIGIDGSMTMLRLFRERYQSSGLEGTTPLLLIHGAIDDVKLADASVDNVVLSAVLLHNSKHITRRVVREARRVLRPGGRLFVLSDLPNSRTLAALPSSLYVLALQLTGRGERNGPVRSYSRSEVVRLFGAFHDVDIHTKGHAILPKRLPVLPESLSRRYRASVHDPVQGWAERHVPRKVLDRMYANVRVVATR